MSMTDLGAGKAPEALAERPRRRVGWASLATNYAAVAALALFIVFFSVARPHTFPTVGDFKTIVLTQSVLAIVALGLCAVLVVAEFDLSIGAAVSIGALLSAKLVSDGMSVPLALLAILGVGLVIGLVNAFLIVRLEVSSFIATLGTGIIIEGATLWLSGGNTIYQNIGPSFTRLGNANVLGFLPLPGLYVIVIALVLWYVLERTPLGREMYVTGYGREAGRLAGLKVQRRVVLGLLICAVVSAFAGFVFAANLGSASAGVGETFLLPAFAAAFLGSTTIRSGRFNIAGTLVAAILLAVGIEGLELMGAQPYVQQFFYGGALIVSVAFAQFGVRRLHARRAVAETTAAPETPGVTA
jgi:ribose transport system permease protein